MKKVMSRTQEDAVEFIELGFDLGIRSDAGLDEYSEALYHRNMASGITLVRCNDESNQDTREDIGYVEVWHIEGLRALDRGVDIVDYCDSVDGELARYAFAIYVGGTIDDSICECPQSNDVLVLHRIEIDKRFRGREYGLTVLKTICERLGYLCGAILIEPGPLQFSDISKDPEWQKKYDTSEYPSNEREAKAKLKAYWGKLGGLRRTRVAGIYSVVQKW